MLTTWDRRENDLDRGKKSVWRVVLLDEHGQEIEPLEVIKDRRPSSVVRAEFPGLGEFATPYIVRFPRTTQLLGPTARQVRLRMSSKRGGLDVIWTATPYRPPRYRLAVLLGLFESTALTGPVDLRRLRAARP